MRKTLAAAAALAVLGGCATAPRDIPPATAPADQIEQASCTELQQMLVAAKDAVKGNVQQQKLQRLEALADRSPRIVDLKWQWLTLPGMGKTKLNSREGAAQAKDAVIAINSELAERCAAS